MNKENLLNRKRRLLTYDNLNNLNPDDVVLVSRVAIQSTYAMTQLRQGQTGERTEKLNKLNMLNHKLRVLDKERARPVYGIKMTVQDVLTTFSKEDIYGSSIVGIKSYDQECSEGTTTESLNL